MWSYMYKEIEKCFLDSRQLCKPKRKSGAVMQTLEKVGSLLNFKNYPSELVLSGENERFSVPYNKGISRDPAVASMESSYTRFVTRTGKPVSTYSY